MIGRETAETFKDVEEVTLREDCCGDFPVSPRESPFCTCRLAVPMEYNLITEANCSEHGVRLHPHARNIVSARIDCKHRGSMHHVARAGAMKSLL